MHLKGNNAEKIAVTLIIFIVMFIIYLFVCLILNNLTESSLHSVVKDGMGFAVTGVTPIIAILLFNDWREEHNIKSLFATLDLINNKTIEIETIIFDFAHALIDETGLDQKEIHIVDHLIRLSLLYRGIRNEQSINEYIKLVSLFYNEAAYLNKLSIVIKNDWNIVKKFEEFNKTKNVDDQVYPIPHQEKYHSNRQKFIESASNLESLINNMIDESMIIKKLI